MKLIIVCPQYAVEIRFILFFFIKKKGYFSTFQDFFFVCVENVNANPIETCSKIFNKFFVYYDYSFQM